MTLCPFLPAACNHFAVRRFPALLPNLTPEFTVDRIMAAVLADQYMVVIPRLLYMLYFLKT